jgi:predicted phosphoribosyltransferase
MLFRDRADAAERLAEKLREWLSRDSQIAASDRQIRLESKSSLHSDKLILSIPRGGVIIGDILSTKLGIKLDIIVSRKVGAPYNKELAIGAVMPDGSFFPNRDIINRLNINESYISEQTIEQTEEITRRLMIFKGTTDYEKNIEDKLVILVDDGVATGATITSAAQWLKVKLNCKNIVIAVPVAPQGDSIDKLNQIAKKLIILSTPEPFYSVGQFYENFNQVDDNEVKEIMIKHGYGRN